MGRKKKGAGSVLQETPAVEVDTRDRDGVDDRSSTGAVAASTSTDAASEPAVGQEEFPGLLVLLCGIPGCGKDTLGRTCLQNFPNGAALSQDEHGGCGAKAQSATESLLQKRRSPIFILRNGIDASDRLPYALAGRRHGYRIAAVWPAELSAGDDQSKAALYLASVAGCYGRLTNGGRAGHETLTIGSDPAKVCISFLRSFRAPSAPGEVDCILPLPFLMNSDWSRHIEDLEVAGSSNSEDEAVAFITSKILRSGGPATGLPDAVSLLLSGDFEDAKRRLQPFSTMRRSCTELSADLAQWISVVLQEASSKPTQPTHVAKPSVPNRQQTQQLQRAVKVRAALEHLLSPSNIAKCRANGSTVTNCVWLPATEGRARLRPAWPISHFSGSPLLRRLAVTDAEVIAAARASAGSGAPLQSGDDGVSVEVLFDGSRARTELVSPLEPLPEASLRKLQCPDFKGDE